MAPQSLPTSWETPMPLVSPPALSCRIHVSSPSSESHNSWPVGGLRLTVDDILSTENVLFVRYFTGLFNLLVFAATPDGVSLGICTGYLQFLCHNGLLLFRYEVNIQDQHIHSFCLTYSTSTSFPTLSLPRQLSSAVPPGPVPEEYLRGFRPYPTTEDALRMPSLPLGIDPATAAAAAAYYHPSYLPHPSFTPYR